MLKARSRHLRGHAQRMAAASPTASRVQAEAAASQQNPHAPAYRHWAEPLSGTVKELWLCIKFESLVVEKNSKYFEFALRYTPVVSAGPTGELLLEIGGSLRLFGGLEGLRRQVVEALRMQGVRAVLACAPAPRAAVWLACANQPIACLTAAELGAALKSVTLSALGWPTATLRMLEQMGVRTVADCCRLPRAGFARRIGKRYLQELDEARGLRPQLLPRYVLPATFSATLELSAETLDSAQLLLAGAQLLERLEQFMRRRQTCVQHFCLHLRHCTQSATHVQIGAAVPRMQTAPLRALMALHLERLTLPEAVTAVSIEALTLPVQRAVSLALPGMAVDQAGADSDAWAQLIERLQGRLGEGCVYGLSPVAEHRPEYAWQSLPPGESAAQAALLSAHRPIWLLAQPQCLKRSAVCALATLPLRAAERIESGWWDGRDVRRDYYAVAGPHGSRWWVYQDARDARWYLHGLFG